MILSKISKTLSTQLQESFTGGSRAISPEDSDYDLARRAWNLSVDQYPALIVKAKTAGDIAEAVCFARDQGLEVAIKATGHGVSRKADGSLLIDTSEMTDVHVNASARTAHLGAGVKWGSVLSATQALGLAPLLGSSPDVGAVGYTLGGGMGWLARKYGLSTDSVNHFDLVTAAGEQIRVSAAENADLFWGLRGGGGNFGVITGMEIRLYPVSMVYGGNLYYPLDCAREAFARYRAWIANAPNELTSSFVLMNFPPFPAVPEIFRGKSFVIIRGCYSGPVEEGEALLRYWREWKAPIVDDFKPMPFSDVAHISNDPLDPVPALSSGAWLNDLDDEVIDTLLQYVPPQGGPPVLMFAEMRHARGAIAEADPSQSAFGNREAPHSLQFVAATPTPKMHANAGKYITRIKDELGEHLHPGVYMNFLEGEEARERTRQGFSAESLARLQALKEKYDPQNTFNHSFDFLQAR